MKHNYFLGLIFFLFSVGLYAADLEGTFTETGSDNTYNVNIQNDEGHVYTGTASLVGEKTMVVNVTDGAGENFSGYAEYNEADGFDLYLKNPKTGLLATGLVDVDEF